MRRGGYGRRILQGRRGVGSLMATRCSVARDLFLVQLKAADAPRSGNPQGVGRGHRLWRPRRGMSVRHTVWNVCAMRLKSLRSGSALFDTPCVAGARGGGASL